MLIALVIAVLVAAAAVAAVLVVATRSRRDDLAERLDQAFAQKLGGLEEALGRRLGEIDERVDRRLDGLDNRLLTSQQSTTQTTAQLVERLTKLDGTASQMLERAGELARLEHVLRPPKARGGFGELLLENLLRDRLPPSAYSMQHTFRNGERVDAIIRVEKLIPIDSKFPLENFERLVEAPDEPQRQLFEKAFARDLKLHVDAIATKYIRPAEDTYDFAFMYLPAEGIYYELACGKSSALLAYAHERRVFPVSPTTFTAYLQVIAFGLKGMEFEENAQEVMAYIADLRKDFDRFRDDFEVVGKHLHNANTKYVEAEKRLDRFDGKLERASEEDLLEYDDEPRAIEAA